MHLQHLKQIVENWQVVRLKYAGYREERVVIVYSTDNVSHKILFETLEIFTTSHHTCSKVTFDNLHVRLAVYVCRIS